MQWGDTSINELDMWASVSKDQEMTRRLETMLFSISFTYQVDSHLFQGVLGLQG